MIRMFFVVVVSLLSSAPAIAASSSATAPKPLLAQIQRLTELLRDSNAVWYPEATKVQIINQKGEDLALAVFTVEGFGGGNNHIQYLAAFSPDTDEKGKQHFQLIDVLPIAGKGWRGVDHLNARVEHKEKNDETDIAIDALEVVEGDPPNFPSKKVTINLVLKEGRLVEQKAR